MTPTNPEEPMPLKPCPFCGDDNPIHNFYDGIHSYECGNVDCDMVVEAQEHAEGKARAIWNKRVQTTEASLPKDSVTTPPPPCIGISPGTMIPEGKRESVSHVMPEEVRDILDAMEPDSLTHHIRAAYAKIAEQAEEIKRLQVHTLDLEAQKKEVAEWSGRWGRTCARQSEEIKDLTSQLSTLKAQMKEVIRLGDEMHDDTVEISGSGTRKAWKSFTAALRQSGQGSTE